MPIYQTARYQVQPAAVDDVRKAIEEFVGGPVLFTDYNLVATNT
jgi:hypothetical protein